MTYQTPSKKTASLSFSQNGDVVTFSKPSDNVVQASLTSGVFSVVCECTRFQISFHFDELSTTYFIVFGHGVTISNFTYEQIQTISQYLGFLTYAQLEEA
ncbi:hypothetical protein [Vibrio sp. 16]|uniref:hypothetical protein n=1 Tax=Vibrio sp. 16 TaxID=391586 RepID=UPI00018F2ECD|nr:hypothetical protein [Vibrio sp. 16]EED26379.1 hypothetical protein VPMS16_3497 [Vibrio sp. 16]CAK4075880.1 hypothetical protein VDT1_4273 [Vibrio sp. 16]